MKTFYVTLLFSFLSLLIGCQQSEKTFSDKDKKVIKKEVTEQFNKLISTLNQKDAVAWSDFYSKDEFISAMVMTDYYSSRSAWVDTITKFFSLREKQIVEPVEVRVTALAPDLALMTSEENGDMLLKNGASWKSKHAFTLVWKKDKDGWKILHSHEAFVESDGK